MQYKIYKEQDLKNSLEQKIKEFEQNHVNAVLELKAAEAMRDTKKMTQMKTRIRKLEAALEAFYSELDGHS